MSVLEATALESGDRQLIEGWQSRFPLTPRPYAQIGAACGLDEVETIARLTRLLRIGAISRIGAALTPNTAGASTLAAMRVPDGRLEAVAGIVSAEPGVNHNYEREHEINLWFVVTGATTRHVAQTLERIRVASALDVLELPLECSYFINLGFPMTPDREWKVRQNSGVKRAAPRTNVSAGERATLEAIEGGLPVVAQPYAEIGRRIGEDERSVIETIAGLQADGVIARFGLIVRHRELGFRANAMAVWDIPDADVDRIGGVLARAPCVTLCYRRPRRLPQWRYNLFCMVHGRERGEVEDRVRAISLVAGIEAFPHAVLFSRRCFKQRGAKIGNR